MPTPLLYHVEEAARILGIGRSKAYQLAASGGIPTVRIGKSVRIPAAALEAWIERNTRGTAASPPPAAA